jgi:hypothetical protein
LELLKGFLHGYLIDDGEGIHPSDLLINLYEDAGPVGGELQLVFCSCRVFLSNFFDYLLFLNL